MKRITIISGHYGSGKSEVSVNLAIQKKINYLIDLDIINPYFRSRSLNLLLEENDIHLVESTVKGMLGSDLPYVSGEGVIPFIKDDITAIYDLGGTENGVRVLIQFLDKVKDLKEIDFLCVVNIFRPETSSVEKILQTITMYEAVTQLKVTGLINNTNLINETTEEGIIEGERILKAVSEKLKIPILFTVIEETKDKIYKHKFLGERLVLTRHIAKRWL